jgi:diguanylate cyclase (GGDEF)-like protein
MAFLLLSMMKERVELRSSEQLRALTLLDGLTGISNRRHFDEQLDVEIRRARRAGASVALLLIDVDHFKSFNDTFGHQQGDQCLRAVAKVIAALVCRSGDLAARYGGEEFAVLLPKTDLAGATELADALRIAVRALGLEHTSGFGVVTVSTERPPCCRGSRRPRETRSCMRRIEPCIKPRTAGATGSAPHSVPFLPASDHHRRRLLGSRLGQPGEARTSRGRPQPPPSRFSVASE